ncbi:MAG TPA: MarC family protein, partial [Acidobacteriota bacterium]|nr:MarC family protein [Acidobacteriota bacterium]
MTVTSVALLLFLVLDPFGNIPFFLSALNNVDPKRHRRVVLRELLIALAVLLG